MMAISNQKTKSRNHSMRQLIYISVGTVPGDKAELVGILEQSRHNNAIDRVTGLLWSDGAHFLQVIEGPAESIAAAFRRIERDARHHDLGVLADRLISARAFGDWTMIHKRASELADLYDAHVRRLLAKASEATRRPLLALLAGGEQQVLNKLAVLPTFRSRASHLRP
jgi:hypothetical protein